MMPYGGDYPSPPRWDSAAAPSLNGARPEPPRWHLRDRLLSLDDLDNLPPVSPLVDGLIYRGTVAQVAGQPGSYKSFLTVGVAGSVAVGMNWEGHRVPEAGPVVYVCPEGASGMRVRVRAWCELAGVDPARLENRLHFLPEPLQLGDALDVTEAIEVATEIQALLVILDTRARCTLGLEENSATDQGRAIDAAERIQRASGATVLSVHHSGRGGDHGRGSNAWDGAVWSDLRVEGGDLRCRIHCEKHKDVPDGCDHHYRLIPHTVAESSMPGCTERQRSTLVAVQIGDLDTLAGERRSSRTVLDIVQTVGGEEGLTRAQVAAFAIERNLSRASAYTAVNALVRNGALRDIGRGSVHKFAVADPKLLTSPKEGV